jgi:DNA polymerase I
VNLRIVGTDGELRECWRALKRSLHTVYDCETTGLDPYTDDVLLMQFCTDDGVVWIVPAYAKYARRALPHLLSALNGEGKLVIGHNIRFDYQFALVRLGVQLTDMWDTQLAEAVLVAGNPARKTNLKDTIARRLQLRMDKELQKSWVGVTVDAFTPTDEQISYAVDDVAYLHRLRYAQLDKLLTEETAHIAQLEFDAIPAFAEMELTGMALDEEAHRAVIGYYETQEKENEAAAMAVIKPAYEALVARWNAKLAPLYEARTKCVDARVWRKRIEEPPSDFYVRLGTPEAKALYKWRDAMKPRSPVIGIGNDQRVRLALRTLGISKTLVPDLKAQTVAMALPQLPDGDGKSALSARATWKKAQKVTSTYGYSMVEKKWNPVTKKLMFHYNQLVSTGRTSSDGGQNMPKKVRACFTAGSGRKFVIADFAAMELRILAGMSGDPVMLTAFNQGQDLHCVTAAATWPTKFASWNDVPNPSVYRDLGKRGNFGYIYGASAKGLWLRGVMPDLETAERVRDAYLARYEVAWDWICGEGMGALRDLYATTALGRKRYFTHPGPQPRKDTGVQYDEWRKRRGRIRRQGMNHPIQGTGADIAKMAMTRLQSEFRISGMDAHLCTMVHDELVCECDAHIADRVATMLHECMVWAGARIFSNVIIDADVHVMDRWEKA